MHRNSKTWCTNAPKLNYMMHECTETKMHAACAAWGVYRKFALDDYGLLYLSPWKVRGGAQANFSIAGEAFSKPLHSFSLTTSSLHCQISLIAALNDSRTSAVRNLRIAWSPKKQIQTSSGYGVVSTLIYTRPSITVVLYSNKLHRVVARGGTTTSTILYARYFHVF